MSGFTGLGFSPDYPEPPQGPAGPPNGPAPGVPQPPGGPISRFITRNSPAPGEDAGPGKSMLTPTGDVTGTLDEMLGRSPLPVLQPLDPGSTAPVPVAVPRQQPGPSATDLASQRYQQLVPRGFSAPRSGLGAGIATALRVTGAAPPAGFTGPPSMNGSSAAHVSRQYGSAPAGPQVAPSASGLGVSQGDIQRRAGVPTITAPAPGQ